MKIQLNSVLRFVVALALIISLGFTVAIPVMALNASITNVVSSPGNSTYGQAVTFTATISPASATGSVQFKIDGANFGVPVTLAGGRANSNSVTSLSAGSHTISGVYSGDSYLSSSTGSCPQLVNKATPTVLLSPTAAAVYGQTVTFTAIVSANGTPTGTVQFYDGPSPLGSPVSLVSGAAAYTTSSLTVSNHTITANCSGDANFFSNVSNSRNQLVNPASTITTLSTSANAIEYGSPVTITARVTAAAPGSGTPTGTVQFRDNGTNITGPINLDSGTATYSTSSLPTGLQNISAVFTPSGPAGGNYYGSSATAIIQTVNQAAASISLISSLNPSTYGEVVGFTATVMGSGLATPTGTVVFKDGATTLGYVNLNGSGVATCSFWTPVLTGGSHAITAAYLGDGNYLPISSSPPLVQVVNKTFSNVRLSFFPATPSYGQTITFTASIGAKGPSMPTGTVQFQDNGSNLGNPVSLNESGIATISTSVLTAGSHSITAIYSGDINLASGTSLITIWVNPPSTPTIVTLVSSTYDANSGSYQSTFGQSVTFTATVQNDAGTPTGTVQFQDNGSNLGNPFNLNSSGVATYSISKLAIGGHTINASYSGDTNFAPQNNQIMQVVIPAFTSITLTASANPVALGQPITFTATAAAVPPGVGTPTGAIQFQDNDANIGIPINLDGSGTAVYTTSALSVGGHIITARYGGDPDFFKSKQNLAVNVMDKPDIALDSLNVPHGHIGIFYSSMLRAVNGTTPFTWSLDAGSSLPAGLTLSSVTGVISGTPSGPAGTTDVAVKVTDLLGGHDSANFSLTIDGAPSVFTTSLPSGEVGLYYNAILVATGGVNSGSGYFWSLAPGTSLPAGLSLNPTSGVISGMPVAVGTTGIQVKATDSFGASSPFVSLPIVIYAGPDITIDILPPGDAGFPYYAALQASKGFLSSGSHYSWFLFTTCQGIGVGQTPDPSTGAINGIPASPGVYPLAVTVTDSYQVSYTKILSLTVNTRPAIFTTSLTPGFSGVPYTASLQATGGTAPYSWSIPIGAPSLPAGLTLNSATGIISGTPKTAGTTVAPVTVTDAAGGFQTNGISITIVDVPPPSGPLVTTTYLPCGAANVAYTATTLQATGGATPYTWSLDTGSTLPAGLILNSTTGVISGTPTAAGTTPITVIVTDNAGVTNKAYLSITVTSGLRITTAIVPCGWLNATYNSILQASGGSQPYTWSLAAGSSLPAGLSLNATSGVIFGIPLTAGTSSFIVEVTDHSALSVPQTLFLTVASGIALNTGWNLISLPVVSANSSTEAVLSSVYGKVNSVWTYNAAAGSWHNWNPETKGDLTSMVDGKGYWINMSAAAILTLSGTQAPLAPAPPSSYPVVAGWNLIGYRESITESNSIYLAGTNYRLPIYGNMNGATTTINAGDQLVPGSGYWVYFNASGTITP